MNTKIFFAFERRIPSGVLQDLEEIGAEFTKLNYDESLAEEYAQIRLLSKISLIRVLHYLQGLNDEHFKYYYLLKSEPDLVQA